MPDAGPQHMEGIAERYFAAWEARDPDLIVALHTEDTTFWSHVGAGAVKGRDAVRAAFAEIFERFPEFGFETHRVLYGEGFWVLDWALTFVPQPGATRTQFDCLDVVNVDGAGFVSRKDTFVDMTQLQAALPQLDVAAERGSSAVVS